MGRGLQLPIRAAPGMGGIRQQTGGSGSVRPAGRHFSSLWGAYRRLSASLWSWGAERRAPERWSWVDGRIWSNCTTGGIICRSDRHRPGQDPEHRNGELHNFPLTSDLGGTIIFLVGRANRRKATATSIALSGTRVNFFAASTWTIWE